jgi:hypothetical protein
MRNFMMALIAFEIIVSVTSGTAAITTITTPVTTEFGTYTPSIAHFTPSVPPYTIPDSLKGVLYANKYIFSDTIKSLLVKNGFAAIPSSTGQLADIYRNNSFPAFVTTDYALHTFHKVYDYMLRIAEYKQFYGQLDTMLQGMMTDIIALRAAASNDSLRLAISRAGALLDVARTLLTGTSTFAGDPAIGQMEAAEIPLVNQHAGFAYSHVAPDLNEDFSQYVPRGHYTIDPLLQRYFRAMMYLGRMNLRDTTDSHNSRIERIETMQALVLCRLLATKSVGTTPVSSLWEAIYNPTSFLVGRSDDLNFKQYKSQLDSAMGSQTLTGDINVFYTKLDSIITLLRKLPKPQILSGLANEQGFRMMGQRFVPDSYVFGQMVYGYVGTVANPRLFPRGLDIMAVLGSQRARHHLIQLFHDDSYLNYTKQLDTLTRQFSLYPGSTWAKTVYWSWMYTIAPLLDSLGNGFPKFMTNVAWADKTLTTSSGSWAELRHDSMLYAKQSYTYPVGICDANPVGVAQGYVEPNPEVFGRLASMASYMNMGLTKAGISSLLPMDKLTKMSSLCAELQGIAVKELQGGAVSLKEYSDIQLAYQTFVDIEDFSQFPIPPSTGYIPPSPGDSSMAVIADVHTDQNTAKVLEVGVGRPMRLFVVVPVEGRLQLCQGAMFSYYEFTQPMSNRLTDEQWRAMLKAGTEPAVPAWDSSFLASRDYTTYPYVRGVPESVAYGNDSIPARCHEGDSVVAIVQSVSPPSITVEGRGATNYFTGAQQSDGRYHIVIPPEALADSTIMTIASQVSSKTVSPPCTYNTSLSYRRLLIRQGPSPVLNFTQRTAFSAAPLIHRNHIIVPRGSSWRVFDMLGRQIRCIGPAGNEWIAPPRLASMPLFLVPFGNTKGKIVRFMIDR